MLEELEFHQNILQNATNLIFVSQEHGHVWSTNSVKLNILVT